MVDIIQSVLAQRTTTTGGQFTDFVLLSEVGAFIAGTFTSTQVIAQYPPAVNGGKSVNTTDMGLMLCDGVRWNLAGTPPIPNGASILGYNKNLYTVFPVLADINASGGANPPARLYSGYGPFGYYPPISSYATAANGQLQLQFPQGGPATSASILTTQNPLNSQPLSGNQGVLPYLLGSRGFYVEAAYTIPTAASSDQFFAFFLEPQEHNTSQNDHLSSDPAGYERWNEFDVNENGHGTDLGGAYRGAYISWIGPYAGALTFTAAPTGTAGTLTAPWLGDTAANWVITFSDGQKHTATLTNGSTAVTWSGAITGTPTTAATVTYTITANISNILATPLDYTVEHIFGMSYDPVGKLCKWYLDGVLQGSASTASANGFNDTLHYFPIFDMQTHGLNNGFVCNLRYFSAWTP